ncbi:unnamed protein product [Schistosoma curassoni]|uniref:Integrase_H2C2 domain-containing protein n=1 Tax=Schistosoma curassoni TaxID=6186 RepID=A0A183JFL8_9TREM|nr:unnamed protein product [Schistosoma curassoni]
MSEDVSSLLEGILCFNGELINPPKYGSNVLVDLHQSHLGALQMTPAARQTCWWPKIDFGINRETTRLICMKHRTKNLLKVFGHHPVSRGKVFTVEHFRTIEPASNCVNI